MIKKRVNKINWHGSDLENNRAKAPNISTPGGNGLDGLNDGEIYVCNADEDPAVFIKTNKNKVARVGGNGSDSYSRDQIDDFLGKKLDKVVWNRNLEERVDDNGKEYLFLTKPLITAYGVTMYAGADVQVPSIYYEDLPIDGVTIQWVDGKLVATGGKGTANDIVVNGNTYTPNEDGIITLPNYPTTLPASDVYSWAKQPNKPSYSFGELSSHPTTLGGYGITDAYTKTDADGKYVLKAGDTITGKLLFNANSSIDLTYIPRTKSAISFNNAGSNRIGINFTDGDGNLRIAKTDINQDWVSGDVNILLGSNNYKVWHAGNDGSGSGLDADLLDGKHLHQGQWDSICYIGGAGVLEIGKYIDFHEEQGMSSDFSCRIMTQGDYQNTLFLPTSSGTLATLGDNVYSATKLQTPRTIFSKPFDGTENVTGGAKFANICIETDNNGNDSGRGSEINNYVGPLQLQQASPNGIHMCMGGGQVGIGTTSPSYKLSVNGDTYCSGKITSENWIRSDLYSAGIDHYADDSYSAAYNACAPNNDNYCCYSIVRAGTIPLGIGFNTNSEIWLGTVNTNRKAAAQWLQISGNRVTCSGDILAYGGITMYGSDETKKNIIERFILPLDYVVNAPLWRYTWRDNRNDRINIGGSAQYTQLMMNELVGDSDKGLTMDYATTAYAFSVSIAKHFQRFLIEDFGRHETEIERLKRENEDMKNRIIELERRAA